jgi:hypothetical protein
MPAATSWDGSRRAHYRTTGVSTFASLGYLTDVVSWVNIYAADGLRQTAS